MHALRHPSLGCVFSFFLSLRPASGAGCALHAVPLVSVRRPSISLSFLDGEACSIYLSVENSALAREKRETQEKKRISIWRTGATVRVADALATAPVLPCVPDRPSKILLVQVGTLSFSRSVLFILVRVAESQSQKATSAQTGPSTLE